MQELLSIAVGPRTDEELPTGSLIKTLLQRAGDTLACRKVRHTSKKEKKTEKTLGSRVTPV